VLLSLSLIGGCSDTGQSPANSGAFCQSEATPIPLIQGDGYHSPLKDKTVTVRGVVTFVKKGKGFYIEDTDANRPVTSSRALFVADQALSDSVWPGQQWMLSGRVTESGSALDKLTSLADLSGHELCAENLDVPETGMQLPLNSREREALEGMRVSIAQPLFVSDVYNLSRGRVTLSSEGVLRVPTEIENPGSGAQQLARSNRNRSLVAVLPEPGIGAAAVGTSVQVATGLLGHNGRRQQFFPDSITILKSPPQDVPEPKSENSLRIVNSNLLNFFNGDGRGGGFPTERGAETAQEFEAQSDRIHAAMARMQPDLLAVQELENDGFGPRSAAASLLGLLNDTGANDWAAVIPKTDRIGGDVITVGLFYRQSLLETVGQPRSLDSPEFQRLSRQPLAQVFRDRNSGRVFLVVVNHLKSKGRCPDSGENADQDDGQGCWNAARLAAVIAKLPWLQKQAAEAETDHILILGDMNAWRREDPVRQFRTGGYTDLVETLSGLPQHSFLYWGQTGTLDYAFASPALLKLARHAEIWHINATRPQRMEQPRPWLRASDHDPVIVDLDFSQSETSD
jgi:predicted extracellular nuclease